MPVRSERQCEERPKFRKRSLMETRGHRDLMPISFKPPLPTYSQPDPKWWCGGPPGLADLHLRGATLIKHQYLHNSHPCTGYQTVSLRKVSDPIMQ